MTYTALVRGTPPVGYWKLNGSGSAVVGASATVSNATWVAPPLVVNSGSALMVGKSGASVTIQNTYEAFYTNYESRKMTFEFWVSFAHLFDGSGYFKNLNSSTRYFTNNELDIITIDNGSTQIGKIFYNYKTNTFRFKINGTENVDAYVPVRNLNNSFYVVAKYSNKTLSITVNGEVGATGTVADTSLFPPKTSSVTFNINGNSINASDMRFYINDLAIYDMEIPLAFQKNRVLYGLSADKPTQITQALNTSYFDFSEKDYQAMLYQNITGEGFETEVFNKHNLIVHPLEGIKNHYINSLFMVDSANTGSARVTASGLQYLTSQTALAFTQYGQIFDKENFVTLTCQITPTTASTSYIFSITNAVNANNSLYLTAGSAGFVLGSYDHANASATQIFNVAQTLNISEQYDVGICIDDSIVYLCTDESVYTINVDNLDVTQSSQLIVGNLIDTFTNNTLFIKNLSMNNEQNNTFVSYDFTENKMFMARLTDDFSISQKMTVTKIINMSTFDDDIVGSKVTWDSMDNCLVESSDDGDYWYVLTRGKSIPNMNYGYANKNKMIRITVPYEYEVESSNQSFSNLNIALYKNLSIISNDGQYLLTPGGSATSNIFYTIKRHPQPILLRQDKFGIYFEENDDYVNGYGVVTAQNTTASAYGLDFWFKPDSINTGSNFLFDASESSTASGPYLYMNASGKMIYSPSTMNVYINGASIANNSFTASAGEYYHVTSNFGTMTNIIPNPSFESALTGWSKTSASVTLTRVVTDSRSGSACMEVTKGGYQDLYRQFTSPTVNTASGTQNTFSAYVKVPAGNESVSVGANLFYYGPSGYTGGANGPISVVSSSSGWVRVSVSTTVPASTTSVGVALVWFSGNNTTGQKFLVDDVMLEQTNVLNNYFEGTIPRYIPSSGSITLNGKQYSGSATHSHGSYGHLNVWTASISAATASSRYGHFVSNNTSQITDTASTLWQSNWNSSSIVSASAFKIG